MTGRESVAVAQPLTTDVEAVPVQGEGNQVGDAQVLMAQLPVESHSVQPGTGRAQSGRCRRCPPRWLPHPSQAW